MAVKFTKQCGPYAPGDIAVFSAAKEKQLINEKFAVDEAVKETEERRDPSKNQDRQTTVGTGGAKGK